VSEPAQAVAKGRGEGAALVAGPNGRSARGGEARATAAQCGRRSRPLCGPERREGRD
jgi:hypothetical protein